MKEKYFFTLFSFFNASMRRLKEETGRGKVLKKLLGGFFFFMNWGTIFVPEGVAKIFLKVPFEKICPFEEASFEEEHPAFQKTPDAP